MSKMFYTAKRLFDSGYVRPGDVVTVYRLNRPVKSKDGKKYHYYLVKGNDTDNGKYASKKYLKQNFEPMREVHPFDFKPLISAFVFGVLAEVIKSTDKK